MRDDAGQSAAVTYSSYLGLDQLLGAQRPRSAEHDEPLFICIHQVYELWFRQLLHESAELQRRLEAGAGSASLHTLGRARAILKTIVAQIDVLETMTPRQFASFRDRLASSSGFQSAQFRELEAVLGRRDAAVLEDHVDAPDQLERIRAAMTRPSLFDSFLAYLARRGHPVPPEALDRDVARQWDGAASVQDLLLGLYVADGEEAQLCERMLDLDEGLQEWRYRHVKMVERTIGDKRGTGGSPGAAYLRTTVFRSAFPDLWAIRSRM